jgi:hypothetical protein
MTYCHMDGHYIPTGFFPLEQDLVQGPFKDFSMVIFLKFKDLLS